MTPLLESMLVVSTSYLPPSLVSPQGLAPIDELASLSGAYGWLVCTTRNFTQHAKLATEDGKRLQRLLAWARAELGAHYVLFDVDGGALPHRFKAFEW